jgi:hypothetical protein
LTTVMQYLIVRFQKELISMRRLVFVLFLCAILLGLNTPPAFAKQKALAPQTIVKVNSTGDFIRAIAPNTKIVMGVGHFELTKHRQLKTRYVDWDFGRSLTIKNVQNLTIQGVVGGGSTILSEDQDAVVLSFKNCGNIKLADIVMGHATEASCMGGVLDIVNCTNVLIKDCDLFGSGAYGLALDKVRNLVFKGSEIRECTQRIAWVSGSINLKFVNSSFKTNEDGMDVSFDSEISMLNCVFADNAGENILNVQESRVTLKKCKIVDNQARRLTNNEALVSLDECLVTRNPFLY